MYRLPALLVSCLAYVLPCIAQDAETRTPAEAGDRLNRLGLSMLAAARGAGAGNVAVSPWPTYRSLSLAYLGARGKTQTEIAMALLTDNPPADALVVREQITKGLTYIEWHDISTVWVSHLAGGKAEYLEAIKKVPETQVRAIDFSNPGKAQVDINDNISDLTKGKIPRLLPTGAVTRDTRFIIASALTFRAIWQKQFKVENTRFEPFAIGGKAPERTPTMILTHSFPSAVYDDLTVLGFPVLNLQDKPDFQLLIFLPKKADGLPGIETKLTPQFLRECVDMKSSQIEVHLPRFHVPASPMPLKEALRAIGIRAALDPTAADFSGLAALKPLYIDGVYDACEFDIDENGLSGVAAMAVHAVLFGNRTPAKADSTVRVDHPFAFALQHIPSGTCLFLGRVLDPR